VGPWRLRASEAQQAEMRPQWEDTASVVPYAELIVVPSALWADDPAAIQATTAFTETFTRR
jgi:hypothetical protein